MFWMRANGTKPWLSRIELLSPRLMKKLLVPLLGRPDCSASDTVPRVFDRASKSTWPSLFASTMTGLSASIGVCIVGHSSGTGRKPRKLPICSTKSSAAPGSASWARLIALK
jgi:hypothetical protein